MKLANLIFSTMASVAMFASAQNTGSITVSISNDLPAARNAETVELMADSVLSRLGSSYCIVKDARGTEIPSQITYDRKLVFPVSAPASATATYTILPSAQAPSYFSTVEGDLRPERADDISWENELVGFRVYGPATQRRGERAFGYDIFFKHPQDKPVLDILYGEQCSSANWAKVDSLRKIDPKLAKDFENSFTYHLDHGLGMDCYAVGPTLGDGVAALMENDSLRFAWCYDKATILDNGPVRFTVLVDFAPREFAGDTITEHRIITLDTRSHLNNTKVWFDNLKDPATIAAGFPRRDDSAAILNAADGYIAYADPTQGKDNGRAMLGVVLDRAADSARETQGHIVATAKVQPDSPFSYLWGFAWDRADIPSMEQWGEYLKHYAAARRHPLKVELSY